MLSALSPARRRLVLTLVGAVLAAVVVLAGVVAVRAAHRRPFTPAAQDRPGPVLLVPGYGGSTSGLTKLAAVLTAHGRVARVVALPGGGVGDLAVAARAVRAAATAVLAATGQRSVDVVGYSAGGVTARLWIRDDGGAAKVRRLITLGSPQHGTDLANLGGIVGCPVACQQLEPDSPLLNALNSGDETPRGPQYVSVWTDVDQTVVPPDSARLDGAISVIVQDVCANSTVSHGDLPTDPLVTGIVLAELSGPTTTAVGPADCGRLSSG